MKPKNIVILGSTGSIGEQALEVISEHPFQFNVLALSCNSSWKKLAEQANKYKPDYVLLGDEQYIDLLKEQLNDDDIEILVGKEDLLHLSQLNEADIILNSLVGYAGFEPTVKALKAGKKVALANKESLVVGGGLINELIAENRDRLIPVDSEHSAMLQCLVGEPLEKIEKLIITASGGPFRTWTKKQMQNITVSDALDHPNWSMGSKITIDSATMMNKGLEIIEAHWMFDMPLSKIEAVVHPQSVIHSVVTFTDGSSKAQLGPPTMKVPILYAFTYPDRLELEAPKLDWGKAFDLTFEPVDYDRFPCLKLAIDAVKEGGLAPAILNAANEVAVQRFLNEEITYIDIPKVIDHCLESLNNSGTITLESLKNIDQQARDLALTF
ncbi:1-deoxy-D-xylulose-5-phosphate reductoisomerase [Fodinibius halophilus]|uniref:1-deoxy-D-xylulose 5-phosphate reductoisomerase n=1 Tax=Fodinibius halophilus TaxID=1736908 RepID=A0A6M1TE55_9BACT|nr:1-deoxy-D-xylulose-5-phosphate reductoisomerase [Fodinibius halophilus]NGP86960.1 1-deoxy-D-xylulose-5-phosphate reductoisomerase [Fodinibius halophilus]